MTLRFFIAGAAALALSACATRSTPYQAATSDYEGFSETRIDADTLRLSFGANSNTDQETVQQYFIYRAAELATEQGFDHFVLESPEIEVNERYTRPRVGG